MFARRINRNLQRNLKLIANNSSIASTAANTHSSVAAQFRVNYSTDSKNSSHSHSNDGNSNNDGNNNGNYTWNRFLSMPVVTGLLSIATISSSIYLQSKETDCCGIVGVIGSDEASGFLIEGLTILRNRGYDSAGVATISSDGKDLAVTKFASRDTTADSIDLVRSNLQPHIGHYTGIGHTRWATHGGKTDANAHPHTDQKNRVAVIHNGTINNSYDLRKELVAKGVKFLSETDTEVIAQLIGLYLDKGYDTKDAVSHALNRYKTT